MSVYRVLKISVLLLTITFSVYGCGIVPALLPDPYFFRINRLSTSPILACYNLSHIDSVDVIADNSLKILKGGKVAFALPEVADHISDFTITPRNGSEFSLVCRTTPRELKEHRGLEFLFLKGSVQVIENGKKIDEIKNVYCSKDIAERIILINDASEYSLQVGCTVVYRGKTHIPGSEYVVLQSHNDTELKVQAISIIQNRNTLPSLTQQRISRENAEKPAYSDENK